MQHRHRENEQLGVAKSVTFPHQGKGPGDAQTEKCRAALVREREAEECIAEAANPTCECESVCRVLSQ